MITGFNTDIEHLGRTFHVQTEDKGLKLSLVETLIYSGGEIVTAKRTSYEELKEAGEVLAETVLSRMEAQHKQLIRDIKNGKFDCERPKPFGYNIITNQTLDEVVRAFLTDHWVDEPITLQLLDRQSLQEETRPTLRMKVADSATNDAIGGAQVVVRLVAAKQDPLELFSAATDDEGFVEASFKIPALSAEARKPELVCEAEAGGSRTEVRRPVKRAKNDSRQPA